MNPDFKDLKIGMRFKKQASEITIIITSIGTNHLVGYKLEGEVNERYLLYESHNSYQPWPGWELIYEVEGFEV